MNSISAVTGLWLDILQLVGIIALGLYTLNYNRRTEHGLRRMAGRTKALELAGEHRFRAIQAVRDRHDEVMNAVTEALDSDVPHAAAMYLLGLKTVFLRNEWTYLTNSFRKAISDAVQHAWEYQRANIESADLSQARQRHTLPTLESVQQYHAVVMAISEAFKQLDVWTRRVACEGWGEVYD